MIKVMSLTFFTVSLEYKNKFISRRFKVEILDDLACIFSDLSC